MAEKVEEDLQKLEVLFKILNEENELNNINLFRMIKACKFKNRELINKDGDLFITVDSLIRINKLTQYTTQTNQCKTSIL